MSLQVQEIACKTEISRAIRRHVVERARATAGHFDPRARKGRHERNCSAAILAAPDREIVTAYASHNRITPDALLRLIENVYGALAGTAQAVAEEVKPQPAVPVKRSVFPDHLICLQEGKKLKMLKRHLMATYKLTPEQYREKWGLSRKVCAYCSNPRPPSHVAMSIR